MDRERSAPAGSSYGGIADAGARLDFPCGPSDAHEAVGLALSGGGYRATLFHLGALWRLDELGWLSRLDRISTVSGGSLMAGILATAWQHLSWDAEGRASNFDDRVVGPTLKFTGRHIDAFVIALGLIPFLNPADVMDQFLRWRLTGGMRLQQLPDKPRFVINAANLGTGVSWRFSKPYMGDYRIGVVCEPDVALSRAIAASAAFPPFVAPLVLDLRGMTLCRVEGGALFDDRRYPAFHDRVLLLDGGAYDNLGIESVEGRCKIVLASDAGGNLKVDARRWRYGFWPPIVLRTLAMAVEGGRAQRRRGLIAGAQAAAAAAAARVAKPRGRAAKGAAARVAGAAGADAGAGAAHDAEVSGRQVGDANDQPITQHVALWRTSFQLAGNTLLPPGWVVDPGWRDHLSTLATRMWPMPESDCQHLVNWGYLESDVMLRKWVPELVAAPPPSALPFPKADFVSPPG